MDGMRALMGLRHRFLVPAMAAALQTRGYVVTTVWTADRLLHSLGDASWELVVLDSRLPGSVNPTDVLDHAWRHASTIAFVLVTPALPEMRQYAPYPNVRGCVSAPGQLDALMADLELAGGHESRPLVGVYADAASPAARSGAMHPARCRLRRT
jgi:hypothetical protein